MSSLLYHSMARALRPTDSLPIDEWASKHVKVVDSATGSPNFSIELTPWLKEPMRSIANNDNKEVVIIYPVGSGKTTILEGLIPWAVSEEPGGVLVATQSDTKSQHWAETRLFPSMKICEPIKDLYPKNRHKVRKDEIIFPHMPIFIGGASMGNLQSSSMRWVLGDEPWIWKAGRMDEAKGRTHDRWNARVVFVSQAGVTKDTPWSEEMGNPDLHRAWLMTDQAHMRWKCLGCGERHVWEWEHFQYDDGKVEGETERDWQRVQESVKMVCPSCGHEYLDEPLTRRKLADNYDFETKSDKGVMGHKGYTCTAMVVPWIRWGNLAVQWVEANDSLKKGNQKPLRIFFQKRLCKFWSDELVTEKVELTESDYSKDEFKSGEKIDNEFQRLMTVDVQSSGGRHFWAIIRAFRRDGTSKLLFEGRVQTWEILEDLQAQYDVKKTLVFIDGQHETEEVKQWCAKNGWNMLHGSGTAKFPHRVKNPKKRKQAMTVYKPFTPPKFYLVNGRSVRYWHIYTEGMKDILAILRSGHGLDWEIPHDASQDYHRQIKGETKKDVFDKKKKMMVRKWVKTNENHMLDCEVMCIASAMITKILQDYTHTEREDGSEDDS